MMQAKPVLNCHAQLGEGPSWDHTRKRLIWVDINGFTLNLFDPVTGINKAYSFDRQIGAAVPDNLGGFILALRDGFYSWSLKTDALTCIARPEGEDTPNRFNDGKCDPEGRFWAGTMFHESGPKAEANLFRLDGDLTVHTMKQKVIISNGLAWDEARSVMYYIDTLAKKVVAYDYEQKTGDISHERDVIMIPDEYGLADGMTIDEKGMLWIAFFNGWKVRRINPDTGDVIMVIEVPAGQVTSCTFGGEDLDELYITTARMSLSPDDLVEQPDAGNLFSVKPGVRGRAAHSFIHQK